MNQTLRSRHTRASACGRRGFTLIELMVVVAIIALLATITIVSLSRARMNGSNAQRNNDIKRYSAAFQEYYGTYGGYPTDTGNDTNWVCLGDYPNNTCWSSTAEDATFNTKLKEFIFGLPAGNQVASWTGYLYRCYQFDSNGLCQGYDVRWFLEGANRDCDREVVLDPNYASLNVTYCQMYRSS